jgi:hypothetical protein
MGRVIAVICNGDNPDPDHNNHLFISARCRESSTNWSARAIGQGTARELSGRMTNPSGIVDKLCENEIRQRTQQCWNDVNASKKFCS